MKIANLSIELSKLQHAISKTPKGTDVIYIPLTAEGINVSKDGTRVFLNFSTSTFDTPNEFGNDVSVYHRETKEDREKQAPKKYLGTGKVVFSSEGKPVKPAEPKKDNLNNDNDPLPF